MPYKLKQIYLTVSRVVNKGADILIYIWHTFLSVLRIIKNTLDAIGYAIAWSLGIFILIVRYSLGLASIVGIVGGLIAILLGFGEVSSKLAIVGFLSLIPFAFASGKGYFGTPYYDD
ncbi:hypothetical protein [Neisseria sp. Ec49-e6-T10]|uniref:hypothetical protein n=1 Tax=Neisseria sp. Ec49-e6-T10 TaxID=3140744 RepID=UPI003EB76D74